MKIRAARTIPLLMFVSFTSAAPQDEPTFRTRVDLVAVPVVVRDAEGRVVGNLKKEDFELFDKGKLQVIRQFAVETVSRPGEGPAPAAAGNPSPSVPAAPPLPDRYIAYLLDDIHLDAPNLTRVREAARRHARLSLQPSDRAAVFTTSGKGAIEFTSDRATLDQALLGVMSRPMLPSSRIECPDLSHYQADLIQNQKDRQALEVARDEVFGCANLDPRKPENHHLAMQMALAGAGRVLSQSDQQTRVTLFTLRDAVRRMAAAPGKRLIVLASPGFLTPDQLREKTEVLERAIRAGVVINSLDARGLWVDPSIDRSRTANAFSPQVSQFKARYARESALAQADVLSEMAAGTGGTFFHGNNDFDEGFRRLATAPETVYILGFSPSDLKSDGSFHPLKVTAKGRGLTATARKGYFAPRTAVNFEEASRTQVDEAVFSHEESRDLPVDLDTQFFERDAGQATVAVLARIDVKRLRFRKADGRNLNTLTIASTLFDTGGNYVTGDRKTVEMKLKDETLNAYAGAGLLIRSSFDVVAGNYLVRLVVRDSEQQLMAARNGVVEMSSEAATASAGVSTEGLQLPFFYTARDTARVNLAADIPSGAIPFEQRGGPYVAQFEVRGTAYRDGTTPVAGFVETRQIEIEEKDALAAFLARPLHYENQFLMASGEYTMRVAIRAAGKEVATLEGPLRIERYDPGQFQISGLALSKVLRKSDLGPRSEVITHESRVPLMAGGFQLFPEGGTRFATADPVVFYFELYEPLLARANPSPPVNLAVQLRVIDRRTGSIAADSGGVVVNQFVQPGKQAVPIALKAPIQGLPAGLYQLEVIAVNSTRKRAHRTIDFDLR